MSVERTRDRTTVVAFGIALVCLIGMVVAVPSVLPRALRDAIGLGPDRIASAPDVADGGTYRFLAVQQGDPGQPVGYDPCKRIELRINPEQAPPGGLALVQQAMDRIEDATGLRFDYLGTTDDRPRWEGESVPMVLGRPRTTPVLVSWATDDEVRELAGDVAGVGGSLPVADSGGYSRYVTGGVTLDAEVFADLDGSEEGRRAAFAIVLHEFGHLVGLGHVNDPAELMNEENLGQLDFGPGDLAGLARVGSTSCA